MRAESGAVRRDNSDEHELTFEQSQRLSQLLDRYLAALEQGERCDVGVLLDSHPDLADILPIYLEKLDELQTLAMGLGGIGSLGQGELPGEADGAASDPLPANFTTAVEGDVSTSSVDSVTPRRLGEFTLRRELGRGGMGIVFEARQESLERLVALKLLPLAVMLDPRQIARFRNESQAAGQLEHPHIVSIYSVGVERGIHYYAMQLVDGESIDRWVAKQRDAGGTLEPWQVATTMVTHAADALDYAHQCGVVHRDIKPSNLLLDRDGKIWVADFGLARCQDNLSLTRSGDLVGTMRYMSPEQASGRAELVDHRTDIYSLAATLYEMLTLRPAVDGEDGPSLLRRIGAGPPPSLATLRKAVPADLSVVLSKAMSNVKDDRYATAGEFASDLRAVLQGRPTVAQSPSQWEVFGHWVDRHRRVLIVVSLVGFIASLWLLVSTSVMLSQSRQLETQAARADRHFRQARDAVERLGSDVAGQLVLVPGGEQVRRSALLEMLNYYQAFLDDSGSERPAGVDASLRADVAKTHSRIGAIVRETGSAKESIVHFRRAEEAFADLAEELTPTWRRDRARNLNLLGLASADAGKQQEAAESYRRAIAMHRRLDRADTSHTERQVDLALTLSNFGLLRSQQGERSRADELFSEAIPLLDHAIGRDEDHWQARRGLSAALVNLGSLRLEDSPEVAAEFFRRAALHQTRWSQSLSNPIAAAPERAATYNNLGAALLRAGEAAAAANAFSQAIRLRRQVHELVPSVDAHRRNLATSLNNLSQARLEQGQDRRAESASRQAIALQQVLVDRNTNDAVAASRLAVMHHNLALTLLREADAGEAAVHFRRAIRCQQRAIEIDDRKRWRDCLTEHHASLFRLCLDRGDWGRSVEAAEAYADAAGGDAERLLRVAKDLASSSVRTPAGSRRDQTVALVASTLRSARAAGLTLDESVMCDTAFQSVADSPLMRRVWTP